MFGGGGRDGGGRGGGRDGGGRGGRDRRDREGGGGPGYRVSAELGAVEKALGKADLAGQKGPLTEVVKALRSLRVKSLEELDPATKGKLITTLLRVQRQTRPAPAVGGVEGGGASAGEAAPAAAGELGAAVAGEGAEQSASTTTPPTAEGTGISEGSPTATAEQAAASPPVDDKSATYQDVMTLVGRAWRAAGAQDRAEVAFQLSGRPAPEETEPVQAPREAREGEAPRRGPGGERGERGPRGDRPPRGEGRFEARGEGRGEGRGEPRGERPPREPRADRPPREPRADRPPREGRGPGAARAEGAGAPVVPAVLNETQLALQAALDAKDMDGARKLAAQLKAEEARPLLERAQAWELLMELYVRAGDFDSVARLYERARQFDQAALAWERAGKLTLARKAYERARDFHSANRVRRVEVQKLAEKGDRLGAATLLMAAGLRKEAADVITVLPAPKAFHFLQRVKLDEESQQLAQRELARAEAEGKPLQRARWLELLGRRQEAADVYEAAGRKDRASTLHEQLGNPARAAELAEGAGQRDRAIQLHRQSGNAAEADRLAALPPPAPQAPPTPPLEGEQESESNQ
jgi:tetratricopeptide (TPR) repeat protein